MKPRNRLYRMLLSVAAVVAPLLLPAVGHAQTTGTSEVVTWTCTSSPCPWGSSFTTRTLVWPASTNSASTQAGYTVSKKVFLPSATANGTTIQIYSGTALLFAETISTTTERLMQTVSAGQQVTVSGVGANEYLAVYGDANFTYGVYLPGVQLPSASQLVTWNCTSSPCPWGSTFTTQSIVWPLSAGGANTQVGYTTSQRVYLPASQANGTQLQVVGGQALVFAVSRTQTYERLLATVNAGSTYTVSGVAAGEHMAVYGNGGFSYNVTLPPPPSAPVGSTSSQSTTWSCTGSPCANGSSFSQQAAVWSAGTTTQSGYTANKAVYLPASAANGATLTISTGGAKLYAVRSSTPVVSDRLIAELAAGEQRLIGGLAADESLAVYGAGSTVFSFKLDPYTGPANTIHAQLASWKCDVVGCTRPDLWGPVIPWNSTVAYANNNRPGLDSSTVYADNGTLLYPYMGAWANGCQVTAQYGVVIIVEWQRGSNTWRETWLNPGQSHTITLVGAENGALIETYDSPGFGVTLANCTPQPVP